MATAYVNAIRDGLLATLQADLPTVLSALDLDPIRTWQTQRIGEPSSAETPALVIRWGGWQQPYSTGDVFDAGASTHSTRTYRFYVWVFAAAADEEQLDADLAAYAEAVAAVLDDVDNCDLGGAAEDVWPSECEASPQTRLAGDDRFFRAIRLTVAVSKTRVLGTYSD